MCQELPTLLNITIISIMKTLVIGIFFLAPLTLKAQKAIVFKMHMLAGHNYSSTNMMTMEVKIEDQDSKKSDENFSHDTGQLAPPPISFGKANKLLIKRACDAKTGKDNYHHVFPIIVNIRPTIIEERYNDKLLSIDTTAGLTRIYGTNSLEEFIDVDSVGNGKIVDKNQKNETKRTIFNIIGKVDFPDKPLNVGDTFTKETPLNVPFYGITAEKFVSVTYKLTKIEHNLAYFELTEFISSSDVGKVKMDVTGGGYGKMVYDINEHYVINSHSSLNLAVTIAISLKSTIKTLRGVIAMENDIRTTVSDNKNQ
jgi:hypothetical protein